jgi:hypothetical protein
MAITVYENHIIENKMTDLVNTKANINALFTVDNSLSLEAGLKKVINKYTYSGTVEKLAKGAKNTAKGAVSLVPTDYVAERYQQTFEYNDEDIMTDPYVLDVLTAGASAVMANHIREKYFAELAKISKTFEYDTFGYDTVVDALAEIGREVEDDMFVVMGLDLKATTRKDDDYKKAKLGEILYTGQFGDISGLPVICSKLVPAGEAYITAKDQIKHFVKKDGRVEQKHDVETKDNTVVYERYGIMALVDETKSIKLKKKA